MNASSPYWWEVNIGSGNGLVPSGNKPLSQCWLSPLSPYGVASPQWVNSSPPGQNGWHIADDTFKCIFVNENFCILIRISVKGPIANKPALVQVMSWRRTGDRPLSEPMLTQFTDAYMRHQGEMSSLTGSMEIWMKKCRIIILKLISVIGCWDISCEIALMWLPLYHANEQSTLVHVMAWCRQATSHYLSQFWPRFMSPCGVTRPHWYQIWYAF